MINSKKKGNAFEQQMAMKLRHDLNWPHCWTSRFMGRQWEDSQGMDLTGTGNFQIQCKACERLNKGYHDILADMPQNDKTNLILHKRNGKGVVASMMLEDLIQILKQANGNTR